MLAGIGGALLVDTLSTVPVFRDPRQAAKLGRLLVQSIGFRDYPVVQGCILLIAITYVTVNLATDLLYGALDPRMRRA